MPTRDDIYRKFGEVSETAQLLETELGSLLLSYKCVDAGLFRNPDPRKATEIYDHIDSQTLGQLAAKFRAAGLVGAEFQQLLTGAVASRNRLAHKFYLQHNLRMNSDDGRGVMMTDLDAMHQELAKAYKAASYLGSVTLAVLGAKTEELEELAERPHLPFPTVGTKRKPGGCHRRRP